MIVAGAFVAAVLGWLAGLGLNRLAAWLLARDEAVIARSRSPEAIPCIGKDCFVANPAPRNDAVIARGRSPEAIPRIGKDCFVANPAPRNDGATVIARMGRPSRQRELALVGATALLAAALWLRYGANWPLLPTSVAGLLLLLIAAIDIDRRLVLNEVLLAGAVLAALYAALGGWGRLLSALVGCGVGLGLFLLIALLSRPIVKSSGGMGAGDVKLAGLLGLMFGYPAVMPVLFLGVLAGGLVSAALLLARRLERKAMIPYAPFLAVGGIITLLMG